MRRSYVVAVTSLLVISLYYFLSNYVITPTLLQSKCSTTDDRNFIPKWTRNYSQHLDQGRLTINIAEDSSRISKNVTYIVPNIVHYIWYSKTPTLFQFHHMLSVLSAYQNIKPDIIYFHTNQEPTGEYWNNVKNLPPMKLVHRQPSTCLFGEKLTAPYYKTSESNVDRLRVLYEFGGIYLDLDVLITKSFNELRKFPCAIGLESSSRACGGIIVCAKEAFFLTLWINSFLDDYRITVWAYNTGLVPYNLWKRYPHLVHVEESSMFRPGYEELDEIFGDRIIKWREKYAVHLWYRVWKRSPMYKTHPEQPNENNVKTWNSTFGEIARTILFGSSRLINL